MGGYIFGLVLGAIFYFMYLFGTEAGSGNPSLVSALDAASMGWLTWTFLIPGVLIAVLIGIFLPILINENYDSINFHRNWRLARDRKQSEPPSNLSAAAVSVLTGLEVTGRTLGAMVIEMCQKGVLRIAPVVGTRRNPSESWPDNRIDYRLTVRGESKHEWERVLCDAMRDRDVTPEWLKSTLERRKGVIGKHLGEHLKERGFFDRNPMSGFRWIYWLRWLGIVLMASSSIAVVAAYAVTYADADSTFTTVFMILGLGLMVLCYIFLFLRDRHRIKLIDKIGPNHKGFEESMQWWAFRWTMRRRSGPRENEDRPYPYLSYAIALGEDRPWMYSGIAGTLFPDDMVTPTEPVREDDPARLFRPADGFFIGMIAADYVAGDVGGSDIGTGGGDMDIDIDLSV